MKNSKQRVTSSKVYFRKIIYHPGGGWIEGFEVIQARNYENRTKMWKWWKRGWFTLKKYSIDEAPWVTLKSKRCTGVRGRNSMASLPTVLLVSKLKLLHPEKISDLGKTDWLIILKSQRYFGNIIFFSIYV